MNTELPYEQAEDYSWRGIGWFRYHLTLDSSQFGRIACLFIRQSGVSEIYLNGQLLTEFGKLGTSAETTEPHIAVGPARHFFTLPNRSKNVIAVRFANYDPGRFQQWGGRSGFQMVITLAEEGIKFITGELLNDTRSQIFFAGFCVAFALLHLFLFLYYPRHIGNLYYALFTLSCAGLAFFPNQLLLAESPSAFFAMNYLFKFSLLAAGVFCPLVLYTSFYTRLPRVFWILASVGIVMTLAGNYLSLGTVYIFLYLAMIESVRVVAVSIYRRKEGARVIGAGFLAFIIGGGTQMLEEFEIFRSLLPIQNTSIYLWGIMGLLIATSIYLAQTFARMNRKLITQLEQVNQLSDKTLKQARIAHEQEMKQKLLEKEIAHNRIELEKAAQLEEAHRELGRANQHLKETQTQLIQSEKMASLGTLVAGIAHEINTPVGAIHSMHNTLMRAIEKLKTTTTNHCNINDEDAELLKPLLSTIDDANRVIESGTDRVTTIVKRLRSFVRLDEAELKKVDINEGMEDTLMMIHHQIKNRVTVNRHYGKIGEIACYPGRLNQVFLNLLNNAQQAIQEKGTIDITTAIENGNLVIRISDDGIGIPSKNLHRIFDPGFTSKGVGVGTGLGLSICYKIIEEHRGKIAVESEVGKGTTFTITIPTDLDKRIESAG